MDMKFLLVSRVRNEHMSRRCEAFANGARNKPCTHEN